MSIFITGAVVLGAVVACLVAYELIKGRCDWAIAGDRAFFASLGVGLLLVALKAQGY